MAFGQGQRQELGRRVIAVNPMAAALAGALISGVGMYVVGTHAQDRFAGNPAYLQTVDGQWAPGALPGMSYYTASAPAAAPIVRRTAAAPRRTVYRAVEPVAVRNVETTPHRSMAKTALIIGGSAASGAGVGGIVGGKKGALLGAAIGGGAASIYEATRR
jgi:hypothetical protein